ncbi:glycosyltransferase [Massilia violaceinigra]|uniref:Glycosyltransferase n=1 Tax=Massilia violaceinigra TaxID=2045208 RepID=A0ABY4A901_9BURK|nr:glycosyltransferase [Massilia violaceinigra]UOD31186.1 glycosyltransferase [Massilia violaceinigra]
MRIVIDLQGAQSESRFRGIGRYSLALALGVARNAGQHEIWLVLNGALGASIIDLRRSFAGLVPPERIRVFDIPGPVAEIEAGNSGRARAAELTREHYIAQLRPDAVLVTSLFEGFVDDAVVSVGAFAGAERTAVVLYDLIPFLNPEAYLGSAIQRVYYERKIASLRSAGLLLAISDYSRQEAIDALALAPDSVHAISTAVDDTFCPDDTQAPEQVAEQESELRARFGINRGLLMYAPGGFDARKNIDGLITAYCLLPPALRDSHQLLIASKLGERDRADLLAHAAKRGMEKDHLILTGYVSDADLIRLYRITDLFIFPSRHEGFGLPALEAMACGAIVIGANNTSIPEVVGCEEALFDADRPQSIAEKIGQVLQDPALRERLRAHGRAQARRFSWDESARKALRAIELRFGAPLAPLAPLALATPVADATAGAPARRPRLAFVSPLPPERTGIADYAAQVLPAMMAHYEIDLIVHQPKVVLPEALAALPQRDLAWFEQNAGQFERIVYQFGNSPYHSHMFGMLARHPGVVVLHDFFISSVLAYEQLAGGIPNAWTDALFHSHGMAALLAGLKVERALETRSLYPCNLAVLQQARRVVVHSDHARTLARHWYGPLAAGDWSVVPLPRALPAPGDRASARRALGIPDDVFLVCSFGFVAITKHTQELLDAWIGSSLHRDPRCELVLVGENDGGEYGKRVAATLSAGGKRLRVAGWTDEAVYQQYLHAADVGVQLRCQSRGETSAAVLDCLNYGLPTIVNANGSMAELAPDAVWGLPDLFTQDQLREALEGLHADPARRAALGRRARELLHTVHSPAHCAALYAVAIEEAYAGAPGSRAALMCALAAQPALHDDDALVRMSAQCIAAAPEALAPRQLLVDVTSTARHGLNTGIERVVRMQLTELLARLEPGLRIEPVYLAEHNGRIEYRYAREYARTLYGIDSPLPSDEAVEVNAGDRFYCADYAPGAVLAAAREGLFALWRARGVEVTFLIHDLLPVLRPEFFPEGADAGHEAFLACIAANADRLLCISGAVRSQLQDWLAQAAARLDLRGPLKLAVLHHGADFGAPQAQAAPAVSASARRDGPATFLMVGTIEPRKGHLQALDAFEVLWREGVEARLVIVGAEGWTPLPAAARRTIPRIVERLRGHAELGKRLEWLQGIGDAELLALYQSSSCLLVPSEGEGFGLPLIEAARYGLPLLARDLPVFREVAGTHAAYFSGMHGTELAQALRTWLAQRSAGTEPDSAGMPWITWRDNAGQLLAVLDGRGGDVPWSAMAK